MDFVETAGQYQFATACVQKTYLSIALAAQNLEDN